MTTLKVSSKSNPNSLAGAIVATLRENPSIEIAGVGAGAINQAIKAIAVGEGFVRPEGNELVCIPYFENITIEGEGRTSIRLRIEKRKMY
ncbi:MULTISPECIES: stage V sporulation protein S [Lysinibacillus]|uniref:stage V sporulation protein S n=1 Tax=Lysinibacillus TaxID=400634 RepID=UPI00214B8174|nr:MULTISPECIES: stage V sporulation protein S [Lysinibacillus]UUV25899.1 stage V sporulation protein S [Lysinibacillus sp. FN11]UYB48772.1 stage V sporulation protein S [Lysinibacillus capsici]